MILRSTGLSIAFTGIFANEITKSSTLGSQNLSRTASMNLPWRCRSMAWRSRCVARAYRGRFLEFS